MIYLANRLNVFGSGAACSPVTRRVCLIYGRFGHIIYLCSGMMCKGIVVLLLFLVPRMYAKNRGMWGKFEANRHVNVGRDMLVWWAVVVDMRG